MQWVLLEKVFDLLYGWLIGGSTSSLGVCGLYGEKEIDVLLRMWGIRQLNC